jgi:hypothetical protein
MNKAGRERPKMYKNSENDGDKNVGERERPI